MNPIDVCKLKENEHPWRADEALVGHFHPQMPDDIEATFVLHKHRKLERMWVRLERPIPGIGYEGTLINTSHFEPGLAQGRSVLVRASRSHPPLMYVPPEAARNLEEWTSTCEKCGCDLVFIPVEDLARMQFPDAPKGSVPVRFTTRCLLCMGTMHVYRKNEIFLA